MTDDEEIRIQEQPETPEESKQRLTELLEQTLTALKTDKISAMTCVIIAKQGPHLLSMGGLHHPTPAMWDYHIQKTNELTTIILTSWNKPRE